jgi:hypothetical protein
MVNVVVMDLAYGVGAVTYADTMLLFVLFLLAPYAWPLAHILLGQTNNGLPEEPSPLRHRWYHSSVVKAAVVCVLAFPLVQINIERRRYFFGAGQPFYGLFDVISFVRNGQSITPLTSDSTTWKRVAGDGFNSVCVQFANADVRRFPLSDDELRHVWTIRDASPANSATLHYTLGQNGDVSLQGVIGSDAVEVLLRPIDVQQFFPLLRPR